ncbi:hypothetical protein SDC9_130498 [bioreactor metagenome]|uniref:Transmembrane protein n=1 Tax=bioreactor metagenome TaxID=1076179 RepID=A0A645D2C4_9ZZZZ
MVAVGVSVGGRVFIGVVPSAGVVPKPGSGVRVGVAVGWATGESPVLLVGCINAGVVAVLFICRRSVELSALLVKRKYKAPARTMAVSRYPKKV